MGIKCISQEESISDMISKYPEVKNVLFELGFKDIIKPGMLQTVGKFMNLKKGATAKGLDLEMIVNELETHGFLVKE